MDGGAEKPMKKIAIVWPGLTGHLSECWKRLSERVQLRVYVERSVYDQGFECPQGVEVVKIKGLQLKAESNRAIEEIRKFEPEVTIVCGWGTPFCKAVGKAEIPGRKVLALDMPWEKPIRKLFAKILLWPYLRKFDVAFVPGKAARKYAEFLGFKGRVVEGMNSSGWERFARGGDERVQKDGFLFVGRDVPEKGLTILKKAYEIYCGKVEKPWKLDIVGGKNFVNPKDVPQVMCEHACLVLPSKWEPWGVVVAEAMSAGICTIASNVCGIVADMNPTFVFKAGCVCELAETMVRVHGMSEEERRAEGERVRRLAVRYSVESWVEKVFELCSLVENVI